MPYEMAEASLRLFAGEVMPELKRCVPVELNLTMNNPLRTK